MLVENAVIYTPRAIAEFPSTKSLLGHTVAIDEVRYNHYRQPVDQARKWRRLAKNLSPNAAMSSRFAYKVLLAPAVDTYYYEALVENEAMNAARHLDSLDQLLKRWHGNRKQTM